MTVLELVIDIRSSENRRARRQKRIWSPSFANCAPDIGSQNSGRRISTVLRSIPLVRANVVASAAWRSESIRLSGRTCSMDSSERRWARSLHEGLLTRIGGPQVVPARYHRYESLYSDVGCFCMAVKTGQCFLCRHTNECQQPTCNTEGPVESGPQRAQINVLICS